MWDEQGARLLSVQAVPSCASWQIGLSISVTSMASTCSSKPVDEDRLSGSGLHAVVRPLLLTEGLILNRRPTLQTSSWAHTGSCNNQKHWQAIWSHATYLQGAAGQLLRHQAQQVPGCSGSFPAASGCQLPQDAVGQRQALPQGGRGYKQPLARLCPSFGGACGVRMLLLSQLHDSSTCERKSSRRTAGSTLSHLQAAACAPG